MIRGRSSLPLLWVLAAVFGACADEPAATPAAEPAVADEVARILRAIEDDPARGALAEVDAAVEDDLPVRAAELLREKAIPAAREAVARGRALEMRTGEGARLRLALVSALEARVRALEQEASVLSRGMVEDFALAGAFRAERIAEEQIVAVAESAQATRDAAGPTR